MPGLTKGGSLQSKNAHVNALLAELNVDIKRLWQRNQSINPTPFGHGWLTDASGEGSGGLPRETIIPTPTWQAVTDPTTATQGVATVDYDVDVTGVSIGSFTLTKDGVAVDISTATFNSVSTTQYTVDLTGFDDGAGVYILTVLKSGVTSTTGHSPTADVGITWTRTAGEAAGPDPACSNEILCNWTYQAAQTTWALVNTCSTGGGCGCRDVPDVLNPNDGDTYAHGCRQSNGCGDTLWRVVAGVWTSIETDCTGNCDSAEPLIVPNTGINGTLAAVECINSGCPGTCQWEYMTSYSVGGATFSDIWIPSTNASYPFDNCVNSGCVCLTVPSVAGTENNLDLTRIRCEKEGDPFRGYSVLIYDDGVSTGTSGIQQYHVLHAACTSGSPDTSGIGAPVHGQVYSVECF